MYFDIFTRTFCCNKLPFFIDANRTGSSKGLLCSLTFKRHEQEYSQILSTIHSHKRYNRLKFVKGTIERNRSIPIQMYVIGPDFQINDPLIYRQCNLNYNLEYVKQYKLILKRFSTGDTFSKN